MSNVRDLGRKINSLQNMQKVTRAMNMISSIKLKKLNTFQKSLNQFQSGVGETFPLIYGNLKESDHPAVRGWEKVEKIHLILFTADKGLCGTHNSSVLRETESFINRQRDAGISTEVTAIGNKGINRAKRKEWEIFHKEEISEKTFTDKSISGLAERICNRFEEGVIQKVYIAGNLFYSALHQNTELTPLLPFPAESKEKQTENIIMEPSGGEMASAAARLFVKYKMKIYLLNSLLSEYSARMTAMENATNNSQDLIERYMTMQNHARQASITNELIEIVSGKEALKG